MSAAKKKELPTHEKCPHCGSERKIPAYVYAHWNDCFTVKCEAEGCRKSYKMIHGVTKKRSEP